MTTKLDINRKSFNYHILDNMKHLLTSNQFADVTLVCDDNTQFRAHSFVLSACSTVFSNLFNGESQSNAAVFLNGINQRDISLILKFMYQGEATFSVDSMESFIAASKSLEVKEINNRIDDLKKKETFCLDNQQNSKETISDSEITRMKEINPEQYIVKYITPVQPNSGFTKSRSNICPDCEKVFYDSSNMMKHYIKEHLGVTYPCDQCDNIYRSKNTLATHKKSVHEGQKIKCEYENCDKEFNSQASYKVHVNKIHLNLKPYHNCPQCDFKSIDKTYLKLHIERKHEGIRFECNECGKMLSSKQRLENHYSFFHNGISLKCSEESCNMKFSHKDSLNRHTEAVHRDIRYPCSECDYQAKSISYLKNHVKTIHEGVRYECKECENQFTTESSLRVHLQTVHEGIKNHKCNQCDFKTASGISLKNHVIAIHEQKKNFECNQCEFKTAHKRYLKTHIGIHKGIRFGCEECSRDFSTKGLLRTHKKASH